MKHFVFALTLALLVVGNGAVAFSQEQGQDQRPGGFGGGFPGGQGAVSVLRLTLNESVQKELGLNEEQIGKLRKLNEESSAEMRTAFSGVSRQALEGLSEEDRRAKMTEQREKLSAAMKTLNEKNQGKIKDILSAAQQERMRQIQLQLSGVSGVLAPEVATALNLSNEQKEKVAAIAKQADEQRQQLFGGANAGNIQERMTKAREATEARDKSISEVLTAEQKEQFEKLKGKPFDVAQLRRGFGGQGGPGRRPGGDGAGRPQSPQNK